MVNQNLSLFLHILTKNLDERESTIPSSTSSSDSLFILENSSNLPARKTSADSKKSLQLSSPIKTRKLVTFHPNQQQKTIIPTFQQFPKEKKNEIFNELITPMNPSLIAEFLKENQLEGTPKTVKLRNIRIHEIESINGDYLRLLNISNSDDYDLSEHFLQQNIDSKLFCRFRFPFNTIIKAGQTLTIWCGYSTRIIPEPPYVFLWKEQRKWETKPECLTILAKPNGQPIASYQNCHRLITDQSSSDILYVHSKSNSISSDISTISTNLIKNVCRTNTRLSSFHYFGNNKPPFAHSPNNPVHPNYNRTTVKPTGSQIHQKNKLSQLLHRPKSSPFASHTGWKQDLITTNLFKLQKQTTVQN